MLIHPSKWQNSMLNCCCADGEASRAIKQNVTIQLLQAYARSKNFISAHLRFWMMNDPGMSGRSQSLQAIFRVAVESTVGRMQWVTHFLGSYVDDHQRLQANHTYLNVSIDSKLVLMMAKPLGHVIYARQLGYTWMRVASVLQRSSRHVMINYRHWI